MADFGKVLGETFHSTRGRLIPVGQTNPHPVFVSKVLLEHTHGHPL
jgi:hypothetical protein